MKQPISQSFDFNETFKFDNDGKLVYTSKEGQKLIEDLDKIYGVDGKEEMERIYVDILKQKEEYNASKAETETKEKCENAKERTLRRV